MSQSSKTTLGQYRIQYISPILHPFQPSARILCIPPNQLTKPLFVQHDHPLRPNKIIAHPPRHVVRVGHENSPQPIILRRTNIQRTVPFPGPPRLMIPIVPHVRHPQETCEGGPDIVLPQGGLLVQKWGFARGGSRRWIPRPNPGELATCALPRPGESSPAGPNADGSERGERKSLSFVRDRRIGSLCCLLCTGWCVGRDLYSYQGSFWPASPKTT